MTNKQNKITMGMTGVQAMVALSEGNIGAVSALSDIAKNTEKHDPDNAFGALGVLLQLDDLGIYGSRIWQLYKDVCGQKLGVVLGVLRATQLGILSEQLLIEHIGDDAKRGQPFSDIEGLLAEVKAQLPNFNVEVAS